MEHFLKAAEEAMGTGWVAGANYPNDFEHWTIKERALACLDPLFFQALGKARGWKEYEDTEWVNREDEYHQDLAWRVRWHRLIDTLASGGSIEDFFKTLV